MLQAIERKTVITHDGKLPKAFKPAFGHRARVIVLIEDDTTPAAPENSAGLMELSGKITSFSAVTDPVAWQREQRSEWAPVPHT